AAEAAARRDLADPRGLGAEDRGGAREAEARGRERLRSAPRRLLLVGDALVGVAQVADAIVMLHGAFVLPLHQRAHVGRQAVLQGLLVDRLGVILAALALFQDGAVVVLGDGGAQVHPGPVDLAGRRTARVGLAAVLGHALLQLAGGAAALVGIALQQALQLRVLRVLSGQAKALLAVLRGLDQ